MALHQTDPYFFIDNLIHKTKNILIIELKTRDKGETILDTNYSCQIVDGVWIPYIVLNLDELKDFYQIINYVKILMLQLTGNIPF